MLDKLFHDQIVAVEIQTLWSCIYWKVDEEMSWNLDVWYMDACIYMHMKYMLV